MNDERLQPLPTAAVARTLVELADALRARLREPMVALFDALDDTLFDLGERAHSGEVQQRHFDALRELRRERSGVQERFLAAVGTLPATVDRAAAGHDLALVDPDELEDELAIEAMAPRVAQRLSHLLFALDQRIAWLQGVESIDPRRNPFGPFSLCLVFRDATRALSIDLQTRLILYKLFERQVLTALEAAYTESNVRLAAAGVLPMLGHARGRGAPPITPAHDSKPAHEPLPAQMLTGHGAPAPALDADQRELLTALRNVLLQQTASALVAPSSAQASAQAMEALEHALARLGAHPADGQPLASPRAVAHQVLEDAIDANQGAPLPAQQTATVDMVGRVFEALGSDDSIPEPMQPVMQTLTVPVMRASLRHPSLIAESDHPLRQLLDLVAESAIGWCPSVDPDARALNDLQYSLQKIASSVSARDAEPVVAQLRAQLEQQRRRSELAEQRAVEAHAGRERLWQARRQVNQALLQTIGKANVPSWVRYLVTRPWMNCLVLLWLRQGPESSVYRDALGFAESLVWCATTGSTRVEQLRMRAMLPIMESQLRQGLATVAYQDPEIRQLVGELQQFVRYRIGDLPPPAFIEAEPQAGSAPGTMAADPGVVEEQPLPRNVNPEVLAKVRTLRPGTWFTFADQSKGSERVKLSWVSPYSGRCLFVNRNGLKISEQRPEELALAIEQGLASIVDAEEPPLQRALSHALLAARKDGGEAKSA